MQHTTKLGRTLNRGRVAYEVVTKGGGFTLIVPEGPGPDGEPIAPDKAAELILRRGFVRQDRVGMSDPDAPRYIGPGMSTAAIAAPPEESDSA